MSSVKKLAAIVRVSNTDRTRRVWIGLLCWAPAVLVFVGAILRLRALLFNAPFHDDEAIIASNIESRDYAGLLGPLDEHQTAPPLFLIIEKLIAKALGGSEMAYRAFPFATSLVVLWLAWTIARKLLGRGGLLMVLAIVSLSSQMVFYSAFVKQYQMEAAVTLILILLWCRAEEPNAGASLLIAYAAACIASPWFSLSSPLVIAALESATTIRCWNARSLLPLLRRLPIWIFALASGIVVYSLVVGHSSKDPYLLEYWGPGFMPLPPHTIQDIGWFTGTLYETFRNPIGLPEPALGPLLFFVGCSGLWRRNRTLLIVLAGIVAFTLLASGLRKYPFSDRLLMFAVVPIALTMSFGFSQFVRLGVRQPARFAPVVLVIAALAFGPLFLTAGSRLKKPRVMLDFRPIAAYISDHWQYGDSIQAQSGQEWQINWYQRYRNGVPGLAPRKVFNLRRWQTCPDVQAAIAIPPGGRAWVVLYKSEGSKLFNMCMREPDAKKVLSTDEYELFVHGNQTVR